MRKYEAVAARLRDRIRASCQPGDELPTRQELAAEYRVAPGTIGNALDVLRSEGWIETAQGARTVVVGEPEPVLSNRELSRRLAALEGRIEQIERRGR